MIEKELEEGDIIKSPEGTKAQVIDTNYNGWEFWLRGINQDRQGGAYMEDLEDWKTISCSRHNLSIWHDEREEYYCPFCEA